MFVAEPLNDMRTERDAVRAALEVLLAGRAERGDAASRSPPLVTLESRSDWNTAVRIDRFECRPSPYGSSCALSEIDATLTDGNVLRLILKDVGGLAATAPPRPAFLRHPLREVEVYRRILAPARGFERERFGTAECYGAVAAADSGRLGLFLERISGSDLSEVGDFAHWRQAARWLADFHVSFGEAPHYPVESLLLKHDAGFYAVWIERAIAFHSRVNACDRSTRRTLARLAENYGRVIELLASFPRGLIHGEFYASNVLVDVTRPETRICPVDWETAAIGPRGLDVAALVAGGWSAREREALCLEYYQQACRRALADQSPEAFLRSVDVCRLQQAVQWMGWSEDWRPPPRQCQDWLGEALDLAERLGILD